MDKTRVVHLKTGKQRKHAQNAETMIVDLDPALTGSAFKKMFIRHYDRIRDLCEGYQRAGLAMVAIDHRGVGGTVCLGAKVDQINVAIVGRHGMADLFLDADASLSLRHLAVIIYPHTADEDVRFRLVDLRTATSFMDENGRKLEALEAEGPLFITCGRYVIFCLPTGDDLPWPEDPGQGWECIPERVYLDDTIAEPDRWRRGRRGRASAKDPVRKARTLVQSVPGPSLARRRLVEDGEIALGRLTITSGDGSNDMVIGPAAAGEGILLGRYRRCDTHGLPVLSHENISRVHLMLIRIAGRVYVIDTASTNGIHVGSQEIRSMALGHGQDFELGENLASMTWSRVV